VHLLDRRVDVFVRAGDDLLRHHRVDERVVGFSPRATTRDVTLERLRRAAPRSTATAPMLRSDIRCAAMRTDQPGSITVSVCPSMSSAICHVSLSVAK
jgi:hypothetical protein